MTTTASSEIAKFEQESARYYRRNFTAGLIHGIFFQMSAAFGSIHTVLPAFVTLLTPSPIAVGLMAAIQNFGEIIPQLFTAYLIEDKPRKKKYLLGVITVRWISWGLLAWLTFQYALTNPGLVLTVLILLFGLFSLAGGMGTVLYADIFARAIPAERRGRFTGARQIGGFALAILAGWIVKIILDDEVALPYPANYSLIFLLSTITLAVAFTGFAMIREPVYPVRRQSESLGVLLRRATGLVQINANFRYLLVSRALLGVGIALAPFYVVHARQNFGSSGGMIGVFLAAQMGGAALSNILWAWLADTRGNKMVIIGTIISSGLASVLALTITGTTSVTYYALVFVLLGAMLSGLRLGYPNFILEMASPEMRATCVALHNTLIAPVTLLPLVAGLIISQSSFAIVFGTHLLLMIAGLFVSLRLLDPRNNQAGACIT
jgi:MFS family permease